MKFPLRHLLLISALAAGLLLVAACEDEGEEEDLSPTSQPTPAATPRLTPPSTATLTTTPTLTPTPGTPTAGADPEDFAEFADLVGRAAAEQGTAFFADRVKGRAYTCTQSDIGSEAWGIEQGLCQEVGQQLDVVEHWYWHSEGLLRRPETMVGAIADYFASALPAKSDVYGSGAVQLYATGTTRSSEPGRAYNAAILTAITPRAQAPTSEPVRTARGVNFEYVEGRWVIIGMLWADVLAEELLSAETAPYDDWKRY